MAKITSASEPTESPTKTVHSKMTLRPRSTVTMKEIAISKRPKIAGVKKKSLKLEADKPKKPPTAFFYYLEDFRKGFKEQNPDVKSMREVGKACGEKWKTMTYEEKVQYYDIATEKRAEFEKAMMDYEKAMMDYVKKQENDYDEDSDYEE